MANETKLPNRVIFSYLTPNRLKVLIGGGIRSILFGTSFCLPGAVALLVGFYIAHIFNSDFFINGGLVIVLPALSSFLVGGSLISYRRWMTFDLRRRSLTIESGILVPMFQRERNLSEFTSVSIQQWYYEEYKFIHVYSVILATRVKGNDFTVNDQATYSQAYTQAATLAKFLDLPVKDFSTDHLLEITPTDLEHPLQARLRVDTVTTLSLKAPSVLRSHIEESPDGIRISIPCEPNNPLISFVVPALAILPITIFFSMLRVYFQSEHISAVLQFVVMGCLALLGCFAVLMLFRSDWMARHSCTVVSIDSHDVRIEKCYGKRTQDIVCIPFADIIDIDSRTVDDRRQLWFTGSILRSTFASKGITLKTKMGLHTFGAGLPVIEIEYIYSLITKALRSILASMEKE